VVSLGKERGCFGHCVPRWGQVSATAPTPCVQQPISGHVYRHDGVRGAVWRAKYRLPDGRQVHKTIGPVWSERGRPRAGYFTKRTAEAWLREVLEQARAGVLPGMVRTGVSFADAAGEYLRYIEHDLDRKPSTLCDYRSVIRAHLLPAFSSLRLEDVTADRIEAWKGTLRMSNRTKVKLLTVLNGVMARARRVHRLPVNPMADVEKPRHRRSTAIEVFSPEEVLALVREADSDQDAAIYLTAAFTGLRRGRARCAPLAGRRLPCASHPCLRLVCRWAPDHAEEREGPVGPVGPCGRRDARPPGTARVLGRRGRSRLPGCPRSVPRRVRIVAAVQGGAEACRATAAAVPRLSRPVRYADGFEGSALARRLSAGCVGIFRGSRGRRGAGRGVGSAPAGR
jgi:hypothetical protein